MHAALEAAEDAADAAALAEALAEWQAAGRPRGATLEELAASWGVTLAAGAQGIWLSASLAAGVAPSATSFTMRATGQTT